MTTSWDVIMPRPPWLASAGCMKKAGVPVEASVEAILLPTWPDLPMPVTTTRPPFIPRISSTARRNDSPMRSFKPLTACASISSTSRASARKCSESETAWGCSRFVIEASINPTMHNALQVALILLASAVAVVVVFRQLSLPPILGYLLVGALVGPHAFGFVADTADQRYIAEFGLVFLLFSVGLEFSLPQLMSMRRVVFGLGGAQVAIVMAAGLAIAMLTGESWRSGLVIGGTFAMSSTAIVSKVLAE